LPEHLPEMTLAVKSLLAMVSRSSSHCLYTVMISVLFVSR